MGWGWEGSDVWRGGQSLLTQPGGLKKILTFILEVYVATIIVFRYVFVASVAIPLFFHKVHVYFERGLHTIFPVYSPKVAEFFRKGLCRWFRFAQLAKGKKFRP